MKVDDILHYGTIITDTDDVLVVWQAVEGIEEALG